MNLYLIYLTILLSCHDNAMSVGLPDIKDFFPEINNDLSRVIWGHAINSKILLNESLSSTSSIMMLEADVSTGRLFGDESTKKSTPIMAHPPFVTSDVSLSVWIEEVIKTNEEGTKKGAKLDFKTLDIVLPSLEVLKKRANMINFPLWLNADILHGPGRGTNSPVDAEIFLSLCSEFFPEATLSLGWTTAYVKDEEQIYTKEMIDNMLETIKKINVNQPITFPIRAAFVAKSLQELEYLMQMRPKDTITIWTSATDKVDLEGLASLQDSVGENSVYFDIPESQMNLVREIRSQTAKYESSSPEIKSTYFLIVFTLIGCICLRTLACSLS